MLDNTEQVAGLGPILTRLLEHVPELSAVVTSRHALRVRGEREFPVGTLDVPDESDDADAVLQRAAVRLFADRARDHAPDYEIAPMDAPTVAKIVRRLDGLPLAIELAAAHLRMFAPGELLHRLTSTLDLAAPNGLQDLPGRQRTIRSTLDWSYELLPADGRSLLEQLSVFAGGWTLAAAMAVGERDDPGELTASLAVLVDHSLITVDVSRPDGARFDMLGSIRAYARERLDGVGESVARGRHLDWCVALGATAQPGLCGAGQRNWVRRLAPERHNFHEAVMTALGNEEPELVVEFAWNVIVLYFVTDNVIECDRWLGEVATRSGDFDEVLAAKHRALYALTRIHHGDYAGAGEALRSSLSVFRSHGMDFESAVALHQLGFVAFRVDADPVGALAALQESSQLFAALGHDWGVALVEAMLGSLRAAQGDVKAAEAHQRESLRRARAIDSDQQVVQALGQLALLRLLDESYDDAMNVLVEAAPLIARSVLRADAANVLDVLAVIAHMRGASEVAARAVAVAAAERGRLQIEPWPTLGAFIERSRRWIRRELGDERFDSCVRAAAELDVFATLADDLRLLGTHSTSEDPG